MNIKGNSISILTVNHNSGDELKLGMTVVDEKGLLKILKYHCIIAKDDGEVGLTKQLVSLTSMTGLYFLNVWSVNLFQLQVDTNKKEEVKEKYKFLKNENQKKINK